MISMFRPLLVTFLILTAITGVAYPLGVTVIGKWLFASQASGSLVRRNGANATSQHCRGRRRSSSR